MKTMQAELVKVTEGKFETFPNLSDGMLRILSDNNSQYWYAFTNASTYMHSYSEVNQILNSRSATKVQCLFVEVDEAAKEYLLDFLQGEGSIASHKCPVKVLYIYDKSAPARVITAWANGVQESTIASAIVVKALLRVADAAFNFYTVPLKSLPGVGKLTSKEARHLEVPKHGHYIQWPDQDIHISLNEIKAAVDKNYKEQLLQKRALQSSGYGLAIKSLRERMGLSKVQIEKLTGLSARQQQRYENDGYALTPDAIDKLSRAHDMSPNEYLSALAELLNNR